MVIGDSIARVASCWHDGFVHVHRWFHDDGHPRMSKRRCRHPMKSRVIGQGIAILVFNDIQCNRTEGDRQGFG